jgi:hypothetical protein
MRATIRLAVLLPLLAACGEGPVAPGRFTAEGRWLGRTFPYELALDLAQDRDNRVTGDGEVRGLREILYLDTLELEPLVVDTARDTVYTSTVRFQVVGRWSFPAVDLTFTAPGYGEAAYAGAFPTRDGTAVADSLPGRLTGSGFGSVDLPLGRVP